MGENVLRELVKVLWWALIVVIGILAALCLFLILRWNALRFRPTRKWAKPEEKTSPRKGLRKWFGSRRPPAPK
jgi:hypothetical protein